MLRIVTSDGATFEGGDAMTVVREMKNASWNAPERKMAYMEEVVERVTDMTGLKLSLHGSTTLTPGVFLMYLLRAEVISLPASEQGSLFTAEQQFADEIKEGKNVRYFD